MKKLFILTVLSAFILSSCSDDDSDLSADLVDQLDVDSEAALESNFEDVDVTVEAGMLTLEEGGRIERDIILDCAIVEKDIVNKIVTIDYGDGCVGPGGRLRKGKIVIEYNERKLIPGAFRIVTLVDFSIDSVQIEGTRTITNISEDISDTPTFSITLVGGKLTFLDETFATRDADHTRTWVRANNPLEDETQVEGSAEGLKRDGVRYTVTILERLIYKRACRAEGVFIPVSGVKQITSGDNVAIIDFGDGRCDNIVTITINGGESFEKELNHRGRR